LKLEEKGKSIRSGVSVYTKQRADDKLHQVSKLQRRWYKLWLSCAEWKCWLEVGLEQEEEEASHLNL